jgi:hypothetical protein
MKCSRIFVVGALAGVELLSSVEAYAQESFSCSSVSDEANRRVCVALRDLMSFNGFQCLSQLPVGSYNRAGSCARNGTLESACNLSPTSIYHTSEDLPDTHYRFETTTDARGEASISVPGFQSLRLSAQGGRRDTLVVTVRLEQLRLRSMRDVPQQILSREIPSACRDIVCSTQRRAMTVVYAELSGQVTVIVRRSTLGYLEAGVNILSIVQGGTSVGEENGEVRISTSGTLPTDAALRDGGTPESTNRRVPLALMWGYPEQLWHMSSICSSENQVERIVVGNSDVVRRVNGLPVPSIEFTGTGRLVLSNADSQFTEVAIPNPRLVSGLTGEVVSRGTPGVNVEQHLQLIPPETISDAGRIVVASTDRQDALMARCRSLRHAVYPASVVVHPGPAMSLTTGTTSKGAQAPAMQQYLREKAQLPRRAALLPDG